jgi:hypothetical protein
LLRRAVGLSAPIFCLSRGNAALRKSISASIPSAAQRLKKVSEVEHEGKIAKRNSVYNNPFQVELYEP